MRCYLAILKIRVKMLLQYRMAALASIFTQLFWGILQTMIFQAFYKHVSIVEPISLKQTITFIWLGQALLQILPWSIDKEIEAQIRSGNIAYEIIRPLHLYGLLFARSFAIRCAPTAMRSIPIFIISGWFLGFHAPLSWSGGIIFCISLFLALFLSSAMTTLIMISVFWTLSGEGIQRLLPHCVLLLSGVIVPLPLFPSWIQPFLNIQPLRCVMDIPCRLYTGVIPIADAPYYWGFQLAWTLAFIIAGRLLMKKALKQFVIQGG